MLPLAAARTSAITLPDGKPYDIGVLRNVMHLYIDPAKGLDGSSGHSPQQALKTFTAAWNKVRAAAPEAAATGIMLLQFQTPATAASHLVLQIPNIPPRPYHIHLMPGTISPGQGKHATVGGTTPWHKISAGRDAGSAVLHRNSTTGLHSTWRCVAFCCLQSPTGSGARRAATRAPS